ncbi:MAG: VRR-NUC domain-containing protein [Janthinobacterium lividum]
MAAVRESTIERHLVKLVKAAGGEVRKVQWLHHRGAPDRLVMLPPGAAVFADNQITSTFWVELKAPGKKAEPHQVREHRRMRNMGQCVVVLDSIEAVDEAFS